MGLAASQARFLAITARKMNCEFQSMQIAQEKLSVTRDLQKAAQDYQNSLTQTKLIWDVDDDQYDLSYGVMMTPSTLNEYDPYLVTDTLGRVLLTDTMFNAAVAAGLIYENGSPKGKLDTAGNGTGLVFKGADNAQADGSRNAFLYQLGMNNLIDGAMADKILELGDTGYTRSGIGGAIYDKSTSNALKSNAFINYLQDATYQAYLDANLAIPDGKTKDDHIYNLNLKSVLDGIKINDNTVTVSIVNDIATNDSDDRIVIKKNGASLTEAAAENLTLGDILKGKYEITYKGNNSDVVFKTILENVAKLLGYQADKDNFVGLNVDNESDHALDMALMFTEVNIGKTYNTISNSSSVLELSNSAQQQNNVIQGGNNLYSLSLTNLLKSYLTNFAISIEGFDNDYGFSIDKTSAKNSKYVTSDNEYYFLLKNDAAMTDTIMLNADFYNMLYHQIVANGAISDSSVRELYTNDSSMMQNAIKNGNLFISSLHNDGYFYQGAYTASGHVAEIPDEDAIARAELEYTITKAKLNTKEEGLEIKMKNLDMEISSLTTEFDTVKNLISKNVEKVFTMFST